MNHEYLWSKTGGDAELEKLESLLVEYRFDGLSTIETPATNVIPVVATVPKRRFAWILAFASTAAAMVLITIWIMAPRTGPVAQGDENTALSPNEIAPLRTVGAPEYRSAEPAKDVVPKAEHTFASMTNVKHRRPIANRGRSVTKSAKGNLTKEEKYAYDQLMFALSIAGSKLRVVQDTIDRKGDVIRNEK